MNHRQLLTSTCRVARTRRTSTGSSSSKSKSTSFIGNGATRSMSSTTTTGTGSGEPPSDEHLSSSTTMSTSGRGRMKRRSSATTMVIPHSALYKLYSLQPPRSSLPSTSSDDLYFPRTSNRSSTTTGNFKGKGKGNNKSEFPHGADPFDMFTSATGFGARSPTASTEALKGFTTVPVVHGKVPRGTGSTTSTLGAQQSNHVGAASTASFDLYQHFLQAGNFARKKKQSQAKEEVCLEQAVTLQEYTDSLESMLKKLNPRMIRQHLDDYVIGQGNAKQAMACAVYNHYSRVFHNLTKRRDAMEADFPATKPKHMLDKSNILLLGPSGSGKTLMAKRIAEILKVPFSTNDATCFTQAGYVGDDVEQCVSRLLQNAGGDLKKTEIGIVFIDEIDKITKRADAGMHSSSRDVAGEGVQQALLKMLEGTVVHVQEKGKKGESVAVDTSNILFILSGAFVGMDRVVQERVKGDRSIGFGAKVSAPVKDEVLANTEPITELDLIHYGLIPEFVGRIPLVVSLNRLTESELVRILKEPKNSLVDQYRHLFATWGVTLDLSDDALHAIARKVIARKTGARGLKMVMEEILKEAMYSAPGSTVRKVVVDGALAVTEEHSE